MAAIISRLMPPNLDVYVLSRRRDLVAITEFINKWVDRVASEQRGDESLTMYQLVNKGGILSVESFDEPAISLTHIVERGLSLPRRAFWVYLKSKSADIYGAILGFTNDNRVIFGVSIDYANEGDVELPLAKKSLKEIASDHEGDSGFIGCEAPPPIFPERITPEDFFFTWQHSESK